MRAGAILLVAIAVHIPAMTGGAVWDDGALLWNNPNVTLRTGIARAWCSAQQEDYQPLTHNALWLQWRLWGRDLAGYHVVNILLHGASAVLLFLVLGNLAVPGAWFAAMVYAVHPVCVSSVAWISEIKNCLAQVFYMLSLLLFLKFLAARQRRLHVLSIAAFALAALSKGSVVMLPVVLLVLAWQRRGKLTWSMARAIAPFFVISLARGVLTLWFQYGGALAPEAAGPGVPAERLARAGWVVGFYAAKVVLPVRLSMIYPRWQVNPASPSAWMPAALLVALLLVAWRCRKRWGLAVLLGLGYFAANLFPVLGFFHMRFAVFSWVADHLQYVALPGLIALFAGVGAWGLGRMGRAGKRLAFPLGLPVLLLLSALTWAECERYRHGESLWRKAVRHNPNSFATHRNLAFYLINSGAERAGAEHLLTAVRLRPDDARLHWETGKAFSRLRDDPRALSHLSTALRLSPNLAGAHATLGATLAGLGRTREALQHLREATRLDPNLAQAHAALGEVYSRQGRRPEAIASYETSLRLNPDQPETHNNLGVVLFQSKQAAKAATHFAEAARLKPDYADAQSNLGSALLAQGKHRDAAVHLREAVRLRPDLAGAHWMLGEALRTQGRPIQAMAAFRQALRLAAAQGNRELARQIRGRIDAYRQRAGPKLD